MKHKFLAIGLPIMGGLIIAGVGIASAAGMFAGGGSGAMGGFGAGLGGGAFAVTPARAAANQATEFQNEATATGLSLSVITDGWAQGDTLSQIATANGISSSQLATDLKNFAQSQSNAELQALVANGTITQSQMTARQAAVVAAQAAMQAKMQNASGTWQGFGLRGKMRGGNPAPASAPAPATN